MAKKTTLSQITPEKALEFYTQTPRDELRAITALGQHLSVDAIQLFVCENWHTLEKYVELFPELVTLNYYLSKRRDLLRDEDTFLQYITYRSVTPEPSKVHKDIMAAHRALRRRIHELFKMISKLKEQGLIKMEEPNPDKASLHFQAAQELAQRLIQLWFINEVVLFGSVARGDFRQDSDIDICLGIVPKWVSSYLYRIINWLADEVQKGYIDKICGKERKLFDFLRNKKDIREMGFLEAGYLLAQDNTYTFTLDKGSYAFNKGDVAGYSIEGHGNYFYTSVFYPGISTRKRPSYQAVLIVDCDAVALFSVRLRPWREGYELEAELKDSHSALVEKYKPDEYAWKILSTELMRAAAERIYKGKPIYTPKR